MAGKNKERIFNSSKRIKLGIWGLGRGLSFYRSARALNFDIVAGCDFNQHMRDNFARLNPGAKATADADEFLKLDFDAVLLATFCPAHADDAIACLKAGKHVLSEVTSFHTLAEGARLVDAVERSGKVYNLAENYPFSAANMWLARKWREGLFGDLMYGEYEYVHECRTLAYTYIDGKPIVPGNQAHSWRSWLNFHYYNTHSLGPMMHITGLRPTRVVALQSTPMLPGYPMTEKGMGGATPSLISMSNGGVVRNLMGATTNDTHCQRLWGTKGSADMSHGDLRLRLGGSGGSPMHTITPHWDELGDLAAKTGHGGGDFWVLYYFARQILTGEPAPFDIYNACDCTIPGLLAFRSSMEGGRPLDVPDFRDSSQRDAVRDDHYAQPRFDARNGLFPPGADELLTTQFALTMRDLITTSVTYRAYRDWTRVADDMAEPNHALSLADQAIASLPRLQECIGVARKMIDAYPGSVAARVLGEMLQVADAPATGKPDCLAKLRAERKQLDRRVVQIAAKREREAKRSGQPKASPWHSPWINQWRLSKTLPKNKGVVEAKSVKLSDRLGWMTLNAGLEDVPAHFVNVHAIYPSADALVYLGNRFRVDKAGKWTLHVGHDAPVRVFVNGKAVLTEPKRMNPAPEERSAIVLPLKKGQHEIVIALDMDQGQGWGMHCRFEVPRSQRKTMKTPCFPEPVHA